MFTPSTQQTDEMERDAQALLTTLCRQPSIAAQHAEMADLVYSEKVTDASLPGC